MKSSRRVPRPIRSPRKAPELLRQLTEMALRLGPRAQLPTFRDLCRQFGVAKVTLSNALRELELRRILVRHHGKGIYVSPHAHQRTIGLVFGANIFNRHYSPFWTLLLIAGQQESWRRGHQAYTYFDIPTDDAALPAHQQLLDDLLTRRLDGLIAIGNFEFSRIEPQIPAQTPVVVVGSNPQAPYGVQFDWQWTLKTGVQALVQQGCRSVAIFGYFPPEAAAIIPELLQTHGLPAAPDLFWMNRVSNPQPSVTREELARSLTKQILSSGAALPDGLYTNDDTLALGVCAALVEAGRAPNRDLRICTTSNKGSPLLLAYEPLLTRLETDPSEIMRRAVDHLTILMSGSKPAPATVVLRPRLILPDPQHAGL